MPFFHTSGGISSCFFYKWELTRAGETLAHLFFPGVNVGSFSGNMPERLSISDFVVLTNEDLSSPGTSSFQSKMSDCRNTVSVVEEVSGTSFCLPVG